MGHDDADQRRRLSAAAAAVAARAAPLALYARQWLPAGAEDVVQSALVSLLSLADAPADPVAWAYRTVRNGAIDAARSSARRRRRERAVAPADWFEPAFDGALDATAAESALRQLPAELREVVVLRIWGELNFAAIATVVGCSVSTAHARHAAGLVAAVQRVPLTFARADRGLAALIAVEAVRSYAAGHGGHLPASLADVADTPVPDNPVTGRPFEWRVTDGVGTLGDHDPLLAGRPLEYTVRIRRP